MAEIADETRARDLLRWGDLAERGTLGEDTVLFVVGRQYWRPVGCSAKLFKRFGVSDPFEPPKDGFRKEHKPVYAAGRFVRIDNHEKRTTAARFGAAGGKNPWWVKRMNDRAAGLDAHPKPLREAKPRPRGAPKPRTQVPRQVHTPDGSAPTANIDRRPPRVASPTVDAPRSGRLRAQRGARSDPTQPRPAPGEPVDRRPPRVAYDPNPSPESAAARDRPTVTATGEVDRRPPLLQAAHIGDERPTTTLRTGVSHAPADGVDRRPPKVHHVPTNVHGEAVADVVRRRARKRAGLPEESAIDRTPPLIEPPPAPAAEAAPDAVDPVEVPAPPVRRVPKKSGGLDDLFGGMQEGRVRIGRAEKRDPDAPQPEPPPPAPAETIDRRPPLLRKVAPPKPEFEPPPPEITLIEPGDDDDPELDDLPPPPPPPKPGNDGGLDDLFAAAPPPRRIARGPMSLDDLFGAAPEGRVRIGRRDRPDPNAPSDDAPSDADAETVDRTPPKIDLPPDKIPKG